MKEFEIYDAVDFAGDVNKLANASRKKTPFYCPSKMKVSLVLQAEDKIADLLKKDTILRESVNTALQKSYAKTVSGFVTLLKYLNDEANKDPACLSDDHEVKELFTAAFKKNSPLLDGCIQSMAEAANLEIAKYLRTKRGYEEYKFKLGARIGLSGAALTASVAVIASTPFHFGAGTIPAIFGMVKSSAVLAQAIQIALQGVDEAIDEAVALVKQVSREFEKQYGQKFSQSKQVLNEVVTAFFGLQPFSKTYKEAKKKFEIADDKLKGAEVRLHELAILVSKTKAKLNDAEALQALLEGAKQSEIDKLEKKLAQLDAKLNRREARLARKTDSFLARTQKLADLKKLFEELSLAQDDIDKAIEIFSKILVLAEVTLAVATANYPEAGEHLDRVLQEVLIPASALVADKTVEVMGEQISVALLKRSEKNFLTRKK